MRIPQVHFWTFGCLAIAMVSIGGCAAMSANECLTVDWRTVGYEDGVAGYSGDRIGQYRKACAKHRVTPDLAQYQSGRDQGLREFCKPANGFRIGARGNGYNGVCPADLDGAFTSAFQSGRQLNTLRNRVANASHQLISMHEELKRIDEDLIKIAADILDPKTNNEERAQLLLDTKRMAERRGKLKADIPQIEKDLDYYQRELDDYRATLAYVE